MAFHRILSIAFLAAILAGCQGMVPQGAVPNDPAAMSPMSTPAAQKEGDATSKEDTSGDVPPPPSSPPAGLPPPTAFAPSTEIPIYVAEAKPQAGGVSALPADVQGGETESKNSHDLVYTFVAEPVCKRASSTGGWVVGKHHVSGTISAVLPDGTQVPVTSGCDYVKMRFQSLVANNTVQCQDLPLNEDCKFNGTVTDLFEAAFYAVTAPQHCGDASNIYSGGNWNRWSVTDYNIVDLPTCGSKMPFFEALENKAILKENTPSTTPVLK